MKFVTTHDCLDIDGPFAVAGLRLADHVVAGDDTFRDREDLVSLDDLVSNQGLGFKVDTESGLHCVTLCDVQRLLPRGARAAGAYGPGICLGDIEADQQRQPDCSTDHLNRSPMDFRSRFIPPFEPPIFSGTAWKGRPTAIFSKSDFLRSLAMEKRSCASLMVAVASPLPLLELGAQYLACDRVSDLFPLIEDLDFCTGRQSLFGTHMDVHEVVASSLIGLDDDTFDGEVVLNMHRQVSYRVVRCGLDHLVTIGVTTGRAGG